jgi:hypothetical protein
MNTYRNLFFIALIGLTAPWLFSHGRAAKQSPETPAAGNAFAPDAARTAAITPNPLSSPVTQSFVPSPSSPPAADTQNVSAENDPEKIALQIDLLSEAEVREWLGRLSGDELTGNTGRLLVRRWVGLDPAAATGWISQLGDAGTRRQLTDAAAVVWSEKDMPAALGWVQSLPGGPDKTQALGDLGYEMARTDPVGALQISTQLPAGTETDGLVLHSLAQFTSVDPANSQQLALSLPTGPLRDDAMVTVATVQAKQDGLGAAQFVAGNIPPGPALDRAVIGVVQLWSQNDLPDASAWVLSFDDSPLRDQASQSLQVAGAP